MFCHEEATFCGRFPAEFLTDSFGFHWKWYKLKYFRPNIYCGFTGTDHIPSGFNSNVPRRWHLKWLVFEIFWWVHLFEVLFVVLGGANLTMGTNNLWLCFTFYDLCLRDTFYKRNGFYDKCVKNIIIEIDLKYFVRFSGNWSINFWFLGCILPLFGVFFLWIWFYNF